MTDAPSTPSTNAAAPPDSPPPFAPVTRRPGLALAVLILGVSMALIDTTIVNVALPIIRTSLDANEATLSWIISGYALAYGLALIPAGRIGDRIGHKPVFIVGLVIFTAASVACGLASDDLHLVIARVVQGLGGGIFFPAVTALIQLIFAPQRRGRAFAIFGATLGLSAALGPLIGGLLIEALGTADGWRSIFFVNVPIGIVAVAAAFGLLPRIAGTRSGERPDWLGLVLLSGALVAILVPLIQGEQEGWPLWTYLSIAGGLVLLALFALWERRVAAGGGSPLVPPHLFSHASFTGGVLLALVYFAAFTSIFFTISLLWQSGLGHSALESGLVSVPFAIGSIVGASQSDRLAKRLGRSVLVLGTGLVASGLIALWLVLWFVPAADLTSWELLGPLLVAGFGSGLFIAPNTQFIVATVDRAEAGAASGVIGTMQRVGAAIGIAVIGSVLFGNLEITGPDTVATGFAHGATIAMAVSAGLAVVAFALVFALPKRVSQGYEAPRSE